MFLFFSFGSSGLPICMHCTGAIVELNMSFAQCLHSRLVCKALEDVWSLNRSLTQYLDQNGSLDGIGSILELECFVSSLLDGIWNMPNLVIWVWHIYALCGILPSMYQSYVVIAFLLDVFLFNYIVPCVFLLFYFFVGFLMLRLWLLLLFLPLLVFLLNCRFFIIFCCYSFVVIMVVVCCCPWWCWWCHWLLLH